MAKKLGIIGLVAFALILIAGGVVLAAESEPAERLQDHIVRGTVTVVEDGRVTLQTGQDETATLLIVDTTRFWLPGGPVTTTMELKIGDPVLALGKPQSDADGEKVLTANLVVVVSDEDLPKIVIRGRVVAVTQQTIVVQTRRGERAITVLPRTRFLSAAEQGGSIRDIREGDQVIALGQPTEFGQWMAGMVILPSAGPLARNGLRGEVIAKDAAAGALTVKTGQRGEIRVLVTEQTRYRIPGIEEPGFEDIGIGDRIVALGRFEDDSRTTFLARGLGVIPPRDENP